MHNLLFKKQDSLGLKTWTSYASEAGVRDVPEFSRCVADTGALQGVDLGRDVGVKLGVHGTPTVVINGELFSRPPQDSLRAIVERLLSQK